MNKRERKKKYSIEHIKYAKILKGHIMRINWYLVNNLQLRPCGEVPFRIAFETDSGNDIYLLIQAQWVSEIYRIYFYLKKTTAKYVSSNKGLISSGNANRTRQTDLSNAHPTEIRER